MSTPRSNSSPDEGIRTVPGSGGGVSVASLNFSSPAFMLSPPPLPTPPTVQTITAKVQSTTPTRSDSRTPMTVQLQRLLQPTPANTNTTPAQQSSTVATPAVSVTTPRSSTPSTVVVPATPSQHTIDQFLQQSGLPPNLSRTATTVVFTVLSWTLHIINLIACAIINRFKAWWNKVISKNFPNTADIIEAFLEYTVDVCLLLFKVAKFLSPYVVWLVQTGIAILLFLGGSFVCGIIVLSKGRDAAENSGAGEVQSSAMKSLNVSIQNSPFYMRKAVPFTPRFATTDDDLGVASTVDQTAPILIGGTLNGTTFKSPRATNNNVVLKRSANKSTPPVSVMKKHSSYQSNPNTPNMAKPTPKTRRVLFSESQHGKVDTEQFFYDKTMPSARKLPGPNEKRVFMEEPTQQSKSSPTNSATNTPVLRPSKFGSRASSDSTRQEITSKVANMKQPNTEEKKQPAKQDEQNKQQHIPNYGHFPSITPLSKRCGRMKRQQGQTLAISNTSKIVAVSTAGHGNNNAKRKRRELIGAASRMGRRRLNNNRSNGSSLPVVLLGKNRKRQREEEQNRTDEWVWRAMNSDGEKENVDAQGATKRTKLVNVAPAVPQGLSTPPKKAFPAASTPPKTPGPSAFSFGSSTPAPKSKISGTPAKTPLPSSSSNDPSSSVGFSFGNATTSSAGADTSGTAKDDSGPSFSFGSTPAKNKSASTFSFGDSSTAIEGQEEKKGAAKAGTDTSELFSFGATTTPVPANAQDTPAKASFSFGSAGQMNNTPATSASTANETKQTPSFSFGGAGETTPSTTFAFGAASQTPAATPAASETKQTPSFAFGNPGTSSTAAGATSTFSFGSTTQTTPAAGAGPAFSFGGQPTGAVASNSFSVGGSSSGASARRRAAASRRK